MWPLVGNTRRETRVRWLVGVARVGMGDARHTGLVVDAFEQRPLVGSEARWLRPIGPWIVDWCVGRFAAVARGFLEVLLDEPPPVASRRFGHARTALSPRSRTASSVRERSPSLR